MVLVRRAQRVPGQLPWRVAVTGRRHSRHPSVPQRRRLPAYAYVMLRHAWARPFRVWITRTDDLLRALDN